MRGKICTKLMIFFVDKLKINLLLRVEHMHDDLINQDYASYLGK